MDGDGMFFNDYCIVCDRAIALPKEPEATLVLKKKVAAGTIRIRNPDGTVTTRTANGQKTTRPVLKRGPNSANRLAAVAAAHHTGLPKPQPLTRSKTAEPAPHTPQAERESSSSPDSLPKTPSCPSADIPAFHSPIYCSRACAQVEADRSTDLARKMSVDSGLHLITTDLPISGSRKSPYGPPSPLFMSGSSTSTSSDPPPAEHAATSAPNFFHMHRDTEEAWRDVNRQRRSSVHPSFRPGQAQRTHSSSSFSAEHSSDSLSSLWAQNMDQDNNLGRSTSGSGKIRMTPVSENIQLPPRGWPTANSSIATSLSTHPSAMPIPAEFGSAPEHTLNLWHSYHNAFSHRDATGTSASRNHPILGTTPTPPSQHIALPPRRGSLTQQGTSLQRPVGGTIRAKSKTDVTWDSFGLDEVNAHKKRHERTSGVVEGSARTPKQSIQIGERGCVIHNSPPHSRRDSAQSQHPGALAIPNINRVGSSISSGRTPTNMPPPRSSTSQTSAIPDLASLRLGLGASGCSPYLSTDNAVSSSQSSAPKSTWNWSKWEKEGGRTYAVPEALTKGSVGAGKTGLFFFK